MKQAGKPEILVKESDPNLTDEDLLEMTNAGIVPATVVFDYRAELWSVVLPDIIIHRDIALTNDANLAWAMRKNSPQLKAVALDMYDSAKQSLVWRAIVSKTIDPKSKPGKRQKNLEKAAAKLMKVYPPVYQSDPTTSESH